MAKVSVVVVVIAIVRLSCDWIKEQAMIAAMAEVEHVEERSCRSVGRAAADPAYTQLSSMKRKMEDWSVSVPSTKLCLANGEKCRSSSLNLRSQEVETL